MGLREDKAYAKSVKKIQQAALEEKRVPKADRVKISTTNMRIDPTMTQKEKTYQVVLDIIKNTTFYTTFFSTIDVNQPHAEGSSEGTGASSRVPNELTIILTNSSEGTSTKPGVPDEETNDEFVYGDEYVHDDVDKEMKYAKNA
uniref:Uncharacterized protein n=1 Tax=Tanacetum cinerariifolium TaxID=118510 RepID=A0A699KZX2_TANCI|nr:hypothetical protein [Tanacetum cinerariifolium]